MLHIVKHHRSLTEAIAYSTEGDTLLLVEDGVYAGLPAHKSHQDLNQTKLPVYCLTEDVNARGLVVGSRCALVGFSGFVELTEKYTTSMTWE